MTIGTHYSLALSPALNKFAKAARSMILQHFAGKNVLLYFRGFSGAAHGLATYQQFLSAKDNKGTAVHAAYVRKESERKNSHGRAVELSDMAHSVDFDALIFIDDFICSGSSIKEATQKIIDIEKLSFSFAPDARWFAIVAGGTDGYNMSRATIEMHEHIPCKNFVGSYTLSDPHSDPDSRIAYRVIKTR